MNPSSDYTRARMRAPLPPSLLFVFALLCAPAAVCAGPVDRVEKLVEDRRFDDASQAARKWLERNGDSEDAEAMRVHLAESEYQRVVEAPSIARTNAWRDEFGESARRDDVDSLEANLHLYAAAEVATEQAYLDVADAWAGTMGAREALLRAEAIAFEAAKEDGSASALGGFLGSYDQLTHSEEAMELWRGAAWVEAEAKDDARVWQDLRMQDPDHPRAAEALLNEQTRALSELGADAPASDLMKLARRYAEGPAGWEAFQRATDHARLRALDDAGHVLTDDALGPGIGPAAAPLTLKAASRVELVHDGRLPRGGTVRVQVLAEVDGKLVPWQRATFRQAARWGVRSDPGNSASPETGPFVTDKPLCTGDLLAVAEVRVDVTLGENTASWRRPATLSAPCAGPLPYAIQRVDERAVAVRRGEVVVPMGRSVLGQEWPCDGPAVATASGVGSVCAGWLVVPFSDGVLVSRPKAGPASYEDEASPWLDQLQGSGWRALDVPDGWHFGGGPSCALVSQGRKPDASALVPAADPDPSGSAPSHSTPAPSDEDSSPVDSPSTASESPAEGPDSPPESPADPPSGHPSAPWLPEGSPVVESDVDGDGVDESIGTYGSPGQGSLVLIGGPLAADTAWVADWPPGLAIEEVRLAVDGCTLRWSGP
jgi:hypothetical protein